jgi:hypothetical protein
MVIDAHTLITCTGSINIVASCNCKDQYGTMDIPCGEVTGTRPIIPVK